MVIRNSTPTTRLPLRRLRDSANAPQIVRNIPSAVNATVMNTENHSERIIAESPNTVLYASKLRSLGIRNT